MTTTQHKPTETNQEKSLRLAIPTAAVAFGAAFVFALAWQNTGHALNNLILFFTVTTLSFFTPLIAMFLIFKQVFKSETEKTGRKPSFKTWFWKDIILSLSYSFLFYIGSIIFMLVIAAAFRNILYSAIGFSLWVGGAAAFWAYYIITFAYSFHPKKIINIIGIYLIGGLTLSAILNPHPDWWKISVSHLGYGGDLANYIMNISLIITGLLLLVMSVFIFQYQFNPLHKRGLINKYSLIFLKAAFIIAPIGLALVGLFPKNQSALQMQIHNLAALAAFGPYGLVMFSAYLTMPFFTKSFYIINYSLAIALVVAFIYRTQLHLSLALAEITCFAIVAAWLLIFLGTLDDIDTN